MSTETILILGGAFAGMSAAHWALKHVIPQLPKKGTSYNVTIVNPSKDFYWRIAGPRATASKELMPYDKLFYPIEPAFAYAKDKFTLVQGKATHVDPAGQTVFVETVTGEQKSIPYAALVIATGFTTPSPLFTLDTDRAALEATYDKFHSQLKGAKTVVIGGAGPVGVETAGEIAEVLNGKPGFMASTPKNPKAKITLISAEKKMLPVLRESISKQAEKLLKRLGVDVLYNAKVVSATKASGAEDAKTTVQLSDGNMIEADIYIDATGTRPNTGFLPKEWLDNRNRVSCNTKTLRVEAAGPRVYVVGDCGSYSRGGIMDQNDAIPVAMTNLRTDLIAHLSGTPAGNDRHYTPNAKGGQLVPIGTQKGVGYMNGMALPSIMVWMIKGRDYLVSMLVENQLSGKNYAKEGKWVPQPVVAAGQMVTSSG
ncbi:FAD/NAD(P)-binding domain-containing protein [Bimuria novae-zelandiae CBS 107.79]|uniref:FAD/NAD(P)-binding domain-containing protein n=1 Tax=Bimuria novae-zelandiae CBS 107.79 TaxID=1447943 RepID=A0A6A5VMQ5_9PLEO|nr:FAD/NAD(P)-binding domain-containing protein [Bimuria novae-zelandiae CBS 107.79]